MLEFYSNYYILKITAKRGKKAKNIYNATQDYLTVLPPKILQVY